MAETPIFMAIFNIPHNIRNWKTESQNFALSAEKIASLKFTRKSLPILPPYSKKYDEIEPLFKPKPQEQTQKQQPHSQEQQQRKRKQSTGSEHKHNNKHQSPTK